MQKILVVLFLLFKVSFMFSQSANDCSCEGIVDTKHKNYIEIFNTPSGQIKNKIRQDFKKEDYLTFIINKDSATFFYLTFYYSISGKAYTGWVKKANYLGTYSRVYTDTLYLYTNPDLKSRVQSKIPTWTYNLLPIIHCKEKWVFIKYLMGKEIKQGWLQYENQCPNPYTTCN